jgi:hypothetical protein
VSHSTPKKIEFTTQIIVRLMGFLSLNVTESLTWTMDAKVGGVSLSGHLVTILNRVSLIG